MSAHMSRRRFLQLASLGSGGLVVGGVLAACGATAPAATDSAATPAASGSTGNASFMNFTATSADQWSRIPADHQMGTLVSQADWYTMLGSPPAEPIVVAGFKGGWGEAWIDAVIASMIKDFPGLTVTKDFDPRIWEKMKPRLVAGEVPDWNYYVLGPWGGEWKQGVEENLVIPVDFLLDIEGYNVPGKRVGDLISPGSAQAANGGLRNGQWALPLSQSVYGLYYNVELFEKNSWPHPADISWEAFLDLCKTINDSGTAPFTYAGQYPDYFSFGLMQSLWYKKGGDQLICDMDNLVEGAFLKPDAVWGVEQVQNIIKNGWVYKGSEALSHTESQQVFVEGNAAMIPNGSWMPNEQRATIPAGFRMKFSGIPAPTGGLGFAQAIQFDRGGAELQIGNGKNPLWGMEVMRRIYSPTVQQIFATEIGSPHAMVNVLTDAKVSAEWQSAAAAITAANGNNIVLNYVSWYPEMSKRFNESLGDLWSSKMTAQEGLQILERGAKEVREDANIVKYTRECADS